MSNTPAALYLAQVIDRLWDYRTIEFAGRDDLFEPEPRAVHRPPVFLSEHQALNVLVRPGAPRAEVADVRRAIGGHDRHRAFASMRSSQALAQSVFANLSALGMVGALADLPADDGGPAFFGSSLAVPNLVFEHRVDHLGEPRSTSVDLLFEGARRVAVECKFTETEVGSCSRPRLKPVSKWSCNGSYEKQGGRAARCSLTSRGVRYWEYVPRLFRWSADVDHPSCPLDKPYQLVRNILAACTASGGVVDTAESHALLIYDSRNPAFQAGGAGATAYERTQAALRVPQTLRRCSWQRLIAWLGHDPALGWLTAAVAAKYGLVGAGDRPESPV